MQDKLNLNQIVYIRTPVDEGYRYDPAEIIELTEYGGLVSVPSHGTIQFNNQGQIIFWGASQPSDQTITEAPKGTTLNSPSEFKPE